MPGRSTLDALQDILADLPGATIDYTPPTSWNPNGAYRITQNFGPSSPPDRRHLHAVFAIPRALIEDTAVEIPAIVDRRLAPTFRPWLFPDPCPIPRLVLFPTLARWVPWLR